MPDNDMERAIAALEAYGYVKDGERFDIGFIGTDGRKHPCPVIIHASSFGLRSSSTVLVVHSGKV